MGPIVDWHHRLPIVAGIALAIALTLVEISHAQPSDPPPAAGDSGENLSDRLNRSDGVIKPPDIERPNGIEKIPPETGSKMPVIPPPSGPEGNQSVEPK